ncbi:MAG: ABC transporter substrate-binding protein [Proteobacteria bacterium]|nr:ABC transporter substrate-binding protein [Pseudomonadota bacterium]
MRTRILSATLVAASLAISTIPAAAANLRIGLAADPETLDPAQSGSVFDRVVLTALCDKLVDVGRDLGYLPQLATEWTWGPDAKSVTMRIRPGVVFHDGEKLTAEAVKFNIERYKTLPESRRKAELAPVQGVDVLDPLTVRFNLSQPYAPLLSVLSDRAGMMVSPKVAAALGAQFTNNPVCSGPYRFVERVAQDRIVLRKFDRHWESAAYPVDMVTYVPITDTTVRLANLVSCRFDIIEQVNPTDLPMLRSDSRVRVYEAPSVGYQSMAINLNNGERANTPFAKNPKVREALELAIDRNALNQVVFNGEYIASNQPLAPGTAFHIKEFPVPKRDVARAKQLLAEAGEARPSFTLYVSTNSVLQQVAQVIQSMASEAGFDIKIEVYDGTTIVQRNRQGDYQAAIVIWSGRPDPDGNISIWHACDGFVNWGKYCDPKLDELLNRAKATTVFEERYDLYRQAMAIILATRPHLVLYHLKWHWGVSAKVTGFAPYPDGLIRLRNVSVAD